MAVVAQSQRALILVAAGNGTRLAAGIPKAFVPVAGEPMLSRALRSALEFTTADDARWQYILVVPAAQLEQARSLARAAGVEPSALALVVGGQERQESVAAGLAALAEGAEIVLVHDAARPLTPAAQFHAVAAAVLERGHGVVPALPVADTLRQRGAASDDAVLGRTIDRSQLVAVQTPQGFPAAQLVDAYAAADALRTDDAAVYAAAGHTVSMVPGDARAHKITTPEDLRRLEQRLQQDALGALRIGSGFDVHAFDPEAPLWLGGLHWPGQPGLSGHSDGDVLSHAICDALLSAAGLGDLGSNFGTDDAAYAGAHGEVFLGETVERVRAAGFHIINVSAQVIANRPSIGSRRGELEARLSTLLGAPVAVSGTSTDGLGFTGRGEGVAVQATALLRPAE